VLLVVGFIGHEFRGCKLNTPEEEKVYKSVSGALLEAVRRAWGGEVVDTVLSEAVRCEKGASAALNVFVVGLFPGVKFPLDAELVLAKELTPALTLLAAPRLLDNLGTDIHRAVVRQEHVLVVPYSALVPLAPVLPNGDVEGEVPACGVWLTGFPDSWDYSDVKALLSVCGVTCPEKIEVEMPACGGFARLTLPASRIEESMESILRTLDGRVLDGGKELLVLDAEEAAEKMRVHSKIKTVLRQLATCRNFKNFSKPGGKSAGLINANRRLLRCVSSVQNDVRGGKGARATGAWRSEDWCVISLCARQQGPQQIRRMMGAMIAVVRGVEGEEYLECCVKGEESVATPLIPAEVIVHLCDRTSYT
jgi:tRNA U38,U39,U40 pseudouridine synthase TruA